MTEPAPHVIRIIKGGSKTISGNLTIASFAWNLTGYTAKLQVRENAYSTSAVATLTENDGIALGGSAGTFVLTFSSIITNTLNAGAYKYDFRITSGSGEVNYLLKGDFIVEKGISQ